MQWNVPLFALALALPLASYAAEGSVALLTTNGAAGIQTGTEIRRDLMGECIVKLPTEAQLVAVPTATESFLHKLDGSDKDDYATVWTSTVQIGWQVRQKFLYVATTKGVGATAAPQFRQDTAVVFQTETVVSDPSESAHFHMTSTRSRYFATAQEADASARKRAVARLRQLQANLCPDKGN